MHIGIERSGCALEIPRPVRNSRVKYLATTADCEYRCSHAGLPLEEDYGRQRRIQERATR